MGTSLVQSLAGLSQAERVTLRERKKPASEIDPRPPEVIVDVDSTEAIRSLRSARDEESRQDHRRHEIYGPVLEEKDAPPTIDVQA